MRNKLKDTNTTACLILPRELKERVNEHSEKTGAPFCEIARRALNAYLAQQQKEKESA